MDRDSAEAWTYDSGTEGTAAVRLTRGFGSAASRLPCTDLLNPEVLPLIEYPGHFVVKRVTTAGTVRFKKRLVFIANALTQHPIGFEEVADGIWAIYFCRVLLGRIDERNYLIGT